MILYDYPELVKLNGTQWYVKNIMNGETSQNLQSQFLRTIYNEYVSIRRALGGNKCSKMRASEVERLLETQEGFYIVEQNLHLTQETANLIVYIAKTYIRMVK